VCEAAGCIYDGEGRLADLFLEVLADCFQVDERGDVQRAQHVGVADTGEL
jgi:hypothetical protein